MTDATMSEQVIIDQRFRGPPESGNGGYVCGVVAGLVGGTTEVTLRRPPPLDRPLQVARLDDGGVALRAGKTVIAEGAPASVEIDVPEPVTFEEAVAAAKSYLGFRVHVFASCFACSPKRAEGDGLRIFPGWVTGRNVVATSWTPDASLSALWPAAEAAGERMLPETDEGAAGHVRVRKRDGLGNVDVHDGRRPLRDDRLAVAQGDAAIVEARDL